MEYKANITSRFAIFIGAFLLIEGIWGMFSPVVFGILTTNSLHAAIHIILGSIGIYLGIQHKARGFLAFLGVLLITVGILRFVPVVDNLIVAMLNVNTAVACLNIIAGILSLAFVLSEKKQFTSGKA